MKFVFEWMILLLFCSYGKLSEVRVSRFLANVCILFLAEAMAVPLMNKKIIKKRVKQFKRHHSDRYVCLKVCTVSVLF